MDREELIKKLRKFKKKIQKKYKIEEMILFGSRAKRKKINEKDMKNDVDLMIIGKFKGKNSLTRAPELHLDWDLELPVDFLCYTKEEFEKLKKRVSIVKEALSYGIKI